MSKIFQIGFHRCGTRSIFNFFKINCQNNLKCLHWEGGDLALEIYKNMLRGKKLLGKYEDFDVYTDMEVYLGRMIFYAHLECYKLLDIQYPDSKFILNTRNVDNWISSRKKHYKSERLFDFLTNFHSTDETGLEKIWKDQWQRHHDNVKEYFEGTNKLLIFDIEKDQGDKIASFFNELKFKDTVFPKIK
jgi:hypothetical protein